MQVRRDTGAVTKNFEASSGKVDGAVDTAVEDTNALVTGLETELGGKIEAVETELSTLADALSQTADRITAKISEAKSALNALID